MAKRKMTQEQRAAFRELTPLQQRVATNVLAGMSYRQAYLSAGGTAKSNTSADTSASEIMSKPKVKEFMDMMMEEAVSDAIMSREEAMAKLSSLARTDLADLVEWGEHAMGEDDNGEPVIQTTWKIKPSALQDQAKMAAIAELTAGRDGIKIKAHSQIQAIQQLSKMQGWDAPQKLDHTSSDRTMSPQQVDASLVNALIEKLVD